MSGHKDWAQISAPKASRNRKLFRSIFDRKEKDKDGHRSDGNKSDTNTDDEKEEGWLKLRRGRSSRASSRVTSRAGSAAPTSRASSAVRNDTNDVATRLNNLTITPTSSRPSSVVLAPEELVRTTLIDEYSIPPETIDLENIRFVLGSKFTQNDTQKAVQLIVAFRKAAAGLMHPYVSPQGEYTRLVGADNWNGVSCYFDSLMVAMFARMDNFEPMLYKNFEFDERRESLATLLRFYVTLLRQGCHITTDMTHKLMESLMEADWCDGQTLHRQQDVSELFQFICDKMDMPLLTLKVDIAHGGKEVREDDHKLVNERMLHIPVPGDDSDPPILLEQCLEQYFSNSVNVRRQIERRKTLDQLDAVAYKRPRSYSTKSKKYHVHVETVEMLEGEGGSPSTLASRRTSVSSAEDRDKKDVNTLRELQFVDQNRWYRYDNEEATEDEGGDVLEVAHVGEENDRNDENENNEDDGAASSNVDSAVDSPVLPDSASISTMVKNPRVSELIRKGSIGGQSTRSSLWNENSEITLPAWMFLQLLPFYSNTKGDTDSPAAVYFAKSKPVLVICLKRFCWTESGVAKKNNRTVVIPDTIHFPSFVADQNLDMDYEDSEEAISDEDYEPPKHPGAFKLVLESAVCHRGTSVHSGHYITLVSEQASRDTVGDAYNSARRPEKSATDDFDVAGARHQFRTRSGTVSSKFSVTNDSARRKWLRFDDFQPKESKFQEIDFEDAFTQESPYLLFYRMVANDEDEDTESEYVQPIPDSHESREFDTDPMAAHTAPMAHQGHKPSIGNIDMDNGRGMGRLRANFGIGGNTGNTSVGVTEVSCDSDDSEEDYDDTVRRNHVTEGVGGTTINGLDTESIFEGHQGSSNIDTGGVSTLGAAPSYESIPSYDVSPTDTRAPPLPSVYPAHESSESVSSRSNLVQVPPPPITVDSPESRFGSESTASSMSTHPLDSESDADPVLNKSKSYSSIMSFLRRESYVAPVPEHSELSRSGAATGTVTPTDGATTPGLGGAVPASKKRFFLKKLASHSSEDDGDQKKEDRKEGHRREKEEKRELEKAEKREKKERKRQQKEQLKEMRDKGKGRASDTARSSLDEEDREFKQYRDEKCVVS
ncbi:hypothetical protein CJU89_4235 [Yarrowia sp. B02]|nr:hypothetical protein CJU89_4235 [Yarrowia sp. B02]